MTTAPRYTVSGPQWPDRDYLTPEQALATLDVVQQWIDKTYRPGWEPKLYRDHEGPYWNISLEGVDGADWAIYIAEDEDIAWPAEVWVEPGAGWCLNLHPRKD